jgi:hypothetical protein
MFIPAEEQLHNTHPASLNSSETESVHKAKSRCWKNKWEEAAKVKATETVESEKQNISIRPLYPA